MCQHGTESISQCECSSENIARGLPQALADEPPVYPAELLLDILRVALLPQAEQQNGEVGGFSDGTFDEGYLEDEGQFRGEYSGEYGGNAEYDDSSVYNEGAPADSRRSFTGNEEELLGAAGGRSSQWQSDLQDLDPQGSYAEYEDETKRGYTPQQPDDEGFNNDVPTDWQTADQLSS